MSVTQSSVTKSSVTESSGRVSAFPPSRERHVRIVLVEPHALLREGLRLLLDREPAFDVVAEAGSVKEATDLDVELDVVVTELELPDGRGREVVSAFLTLDPAVAVVVVTFVDQPARVQEALAAGAAGYVLKTAGPEELLLGIRTVAHGRRYLQPSLGAELACLTGTAGNGSLPGALSDREAQILRLVALGHTNAEIGRRLAISLRTVETHRGHIAQKLGRRTRAELVRYAYEAGLVDRA